MVCHIARVEDAKFVDFVNLGLSGWVFGFRFRNGWGTENVVVVEFAVGLNGGEGAECVTAGFCGDEGEEIGENVGSSIFFEAP